MIVLISESLLQRSTATDGRILRDRFLQGFCVRLNKRKRTFLVATSVRGQQFRMMLGYALEVGEHEYQCRTEMGCLGLHQLHRERGSVVPVVRSYIQQLRDYWISQTNHS